MSGYKKIPTYEEYNQRHPHLVSEGKVVCVNQVYIQRIGNVGTTILNSHICRHCGTTLYRLQS